MSKYTLLIDQGKDHAMIKPVQNLSTKCHAIIIKRKGLIAASSPVYKRLKNERKKHGISSTEFSTSESL